MWLRYTDLMSKFVRLSIYFDRARITAQEVRVKNMTYKINSRAGMPNSSEGCCDGLKSMCENRA